MAGAQAAHRIVIVGGGAGGIELATRLGRTLGRAGQAQVVLVDGAATHIWKPLLHEVATGALNTGEDEVNYFAHAWRNGYHFEYGWMTGLDREQRRITLAEVRDEEGSLIVEARSMPYDTLVIAVGAVANDFGTPGAREHCMFLNNPAEAERLRKRILALTFAASTRVNPGTPLRIAIIGAGPTGVELAAEIHHTICEMHHYGANFSPTQLEITLIEASERILAAAPPALADYARAELEKRNIQIFTHRRVSEVAPGQVMLADGTCLAVDVAVWAAGVKGAPWLSGLGLAVNRHNQIEVNATLQTAADPAIFALGDCASAPDGEGGPPLPATAQVAHQQAAWLAQALADQLAGRKPKPFVFEPQGIMVSLGKHTAVGSLAAIIGPKRDYYVAGRSAKLIYTSLYRIHQATLHGWVRTVLLWIGDKLRRVARPAIKLH
ncbi:FAD-dependent oxidoreductase [Chitiniphilus purpureus]|uniref:FAD-dependent oxidoreductase n=1 Tax=Chitiniphilus purpureus TaxID=2981137 RepID=A0ABY6DMX3_9NEIS|nr:FAD-dependent oxidoreductase [Chitiniphilus sp. CD1]UXY15725.1 FAD-dependent oxidoreductase [Chitiniphilus sp. CD1]